MDVSRGPAWGGLRTVRDWRLGPVERKPAALGESFHHRLQRDEPREIRSMERSFKKEVQALKLGDGETFHGEGILAVTKALLQSGVSYVGGYQGAPVSHLLDV